MSARRRTARGEGLEVNLPPVDVLERRARVLALVDALLEPDAAFRRFCFDPDWGDGARLLTLRSGEGDHAFLALTPDGALLRGRPAEALAVRADRLFTGIPAALAPLVDEPAFALGGDAFAAWHATSEATWRAAVSLEGHGVSELLAPLGDAPAVAATLAEAVWGRRPHAASLSLLWSGAPVTRDLLAALLPDLDLDVALSQARALGLPVSDAARPEAERAPPRKARVAPAASRASAKTATAKPAMATEPAKPAGPEEDDGTVGEAEFKVIRVGDETRLVVGGKVQLRAARPGLYLELLEAVRAALRAAT